MRPQQPRLLAPQLGAWLHLRRREAVELPDPTEGNDTNTDPHGTTGSVVRSTARARSNFSLLPFNTECFSISIIFSYTDILLPLQV